MLYIGVVISQSGNSLEDALLMLGVMKLHYPFKISEQHLFFILQNYLGKFVCLEIFVKHRKVFDIGQAVQIIGYRVIDDGGIFD